VLRCCCRGKGGKRRQAGFSLAPLAIAQSELVNLHIPIIAEAHKGVDMTTEAA